jgi:CubicO group peptidase (beta-lactamase class C family)
MVKVKYANIIKAKSIIIFILSSKRKIIQFSSSTNIQQVNKTCMMFLWILVIIIVCVLAYLVLSKKTELGININPGSTSGATIADYDNAFLKATRADGVGGLAVGLVGPNGLEWSNSYGNVGTRDIGEDTIFRVASISKMFTAIIALMLVRKGKIKLSDCANKYIPEIKRLESLKGYQDCVTIHQLLSQTSGIDRVSDENIDQNGDIQQWDKALVKSLEHTGFTWKPGSHYEYSNMGYALLGLVLERAADMGYFEMVNKWIFEPLGMNNTSFEFPTEKADRVADARYNHGEEYKIGKPTDDHQGAAVIYGGAYSTIADLAKFMSALMGSSLLTDSEKELMFKPHNPNPLVNQLYGYGTEIQRSNHNIVGHSGALPGYKTQLGYHRKKKKGVIILRNYFTGQVKLGGTMLAMIRDLA